MKKVLRNTVSIFIGVIMLMPTFLLMGVSVAHAEDFQTRPDAPFLVSCSGVVSEDVNGTQLPACNWCTFVQLIGQMVQYSIYLSVMLSAIMFAYAGFLFLTNNGKQDNITKAWNIFRRSLLGTVAILAAWLIVNAIMTKLAVGLGLGDNWNSVTGCSEVETRSYLNSEEASTLGLGNNDGYVDINYVSQAYQEQVQMQDGVLNEFGYSGIGGGTISGTHPQNHLASDKREYKLPDHLRNVRYSDGRVALKNAGFKFNKACKKSNMSGTCFYGIQDRVINTSLKIKEECKSFNGAECGAIVNGGSERAGHSKNSKHYKGSAIDFSVKNRDFLNHMQSTTNNDFERVNKDRGGKYGGPTYRHKSSGMLCVYENKIFAGHGPHIHCEF